MTLLQFINKDNIFDEKRTQEDFIRRCNDAGIVLISNREVYQIGKSGSDAEISELRKDFKKYWLVTSTRYTYNPNNLDAVITHYYDSNVTKPVVEDTLEIPVYVWAKVGPLLDSQEGLRVFQANFGTTDNSKEIEDVLSRLSGKSVDNTYFWTPNQESRKNVSARAAGFDYYYDDFLVSGISLIDSPGRSRGVAFQSAEQTQKISVPQEIELPQEPTRKDILYIVAQRSFEAAVKRLDKNDFSDLQDPVAYDAFLRELSGEKDPITENEVRRMLDRSANVLELSKNHSSHELTSLRKMLGITLARENSK